MRQKIAIFANGWGCEFLREVVTGVMEVATEKNFDMFSFVNFSTTAGDKKQNHGEINVFKLPDLSEFAGVIILTNSFNTEEELAYLQKHIKEVGIPAVSLGGELNDMLSIRTDNYYGMYELTSHIIRDHGVRDFVFLGGPKEHEENQERLQAVLDVVEEMEFELPKENILYGDWARVKARILISDWFETQKRIPQAILCANDMMAIGVCDYLKKQGIRIPDDVIVTGYDCTKMGQDYLPAISSVSHEWFRMGIHAMNLLTDQINGKEVVSPEPTKTRFVRGCSCGCIYSRYEAQAQIDIGKSHKHEVIQGSLCDSHFRHIYKAIHECKDPDSLHTNLARLLSGEHWMEGDNFLLCLESEVFQTQDDSKLFRNGYSMEMDAVCVLDNGKVGPHCKIRTKDIFSTFAKEQREPSHYIVVSLSNGAQIYGFAILNRSIDIALDNYLYSWTRHMDMYLDQMRRNIKLAELTKQLQVASVTDVLTGVYNRAGCEEIAYPMLQNYHKSGKEGVIMIVDVDHMKQINDRYGHANGDLAVKIVANTLKMEVPSGWVVSRFGGDEFLVGGLLTDRIQMDEMELMITERLRKEAERKQIPFVLTISIGYKVIDCKEPFDIEQSLKDADASMYFVKQCHHEGNDELGR